MPDDFDKMAAVVDWLDACRSRNLEQLLDCYADDASLECACEPISLRGRDGLAAYWKARLQGLEQGLGPTAFGLEEIAPMADGVMLNYLDCEGKPVRIAFAFNAEGKISHVRCEPAR